MLNKHIIGYFIGVLIILFVGVGNCQVSLKILKRSIKIFSIKIIVLIAVSNTKMERQNIIWRKAKNVPIVMKLVLLLAQLIIDPIVHINRKQT